jgi:hypothetical protein
MFGLRIGGITLARHFPLELRTPHLLLLVVARLIKDNARLREEGKQLRAAINVYRELANRVLES